MNAKNNNKFGWLGCVAVVWLLAAVPTALAGECYWTSTADGTYSDGGNWLSGLVPGGLDNANFTNNASYTVTWNADASVSNVYFNPKSGTVTLNPGSAVWTVANVFSAGGNAGTTGTVVQTGGKLVAGGVYAGNGGQGAYTLTNGIMVAGGVTVGNQASSVNSRMLVTGSVVTNNGGTTVGTSGPGANLTVANGTYMRAAGGLNIGINGTATGCKMLVTDTGTVVSTTTVNFGLNGAYSGGGYNQLVVSNGANLSASGNLKLGNDPTSAGSVITVTGTGSVFSIGGYAYLGLMGPNNQLVVTNGGTVNGYELHLAAGGDAGHPNGTNNSVLVTGTNSTLYMWGNFNMGEGYSARGRLVVNNGGNANLANSISIGAAGTSPGHEIIVSDPGSVLSMGPGYGIWMGPSSGNRLVVTNGGRVNLNSSLTVSSGAAATNNSVLVTGANSMLWLTRSGATRTITIGSAASASLLVLDQGIVELSGNGATGSALATGAYGVITNWGGVYQFAGGIDANQIVNGTPGSIVITNGTVSFRAVTTASVFCNQSGQPLDSTNKMVWMGDNTFRLNNATNVAGQNYTFQTGTATNFAGLSLINGSRYRGNVSVGTGGTLSFAGGEQTLAGNLTMQSDATLALSLAGSNDYLTVTGAVNLASAQLQVTLATDPTLLYPIRFLRTGGLGGTKLGVNWVEAAYGGKIYGMKVRYDENGNDALLLELGPKGTMVMLY